MPILYVAKQPACPACKLAETELRGFSACKVVVFDATKAQSAWPAAMRGRTDIIDTPTYFLQDDAGVLHGPKRNAQSASMLVVWVAREGAPKAAPKAALKAAPKAAPKGFLRGAKP